MSRGRLSHYPLPLHQIHQPFSPNAVPRILNYIHIPAEHHPALTTEVPIWILRRYLLRNVITSVPVLLTLNAADAVLVLGGLGFLGLGLPETIPEWGGDL